MLILESFQAGLSWECVLNKRHDFEVAYDYFDINKIINYDEDKINELLLNKKIIRNKLKIKASINNAKIFEYIQKSVKWEYKKSLLNQYNDSESNALSIANNQRILHDFLFGKDLEFENIDISKRPKTYFPHRTKTTLEYYFENEKIIAKNQQIEIDLTIEFNGTIGIFEAKNGSPNNFNIYQIYHPFLYYSTPLPSRLLIHTAQ